MTRMTVHAPTLPLGGRQRWALAAAGLAAALVAALLAPGGGGWQLVVFLVAPDLAGLLSVDHSLERGRMHPRAVPLYNLLHAPALPLALGLAALVWLGTPWLVAALAWGLHIAADRAVGYGPRDRDGFQRGAGATPSRGGRHG